MDAVKRNQLRPRHYLGKSSAHRADVNLTFSNEEVLGSGPIKGIPKAGLA